MSGDDVSITMKSQRPYMLRAFYDWIVDSGGTPQLLVDASAPGVMVPPFVVKDGRVVLNIAPRAVRELVIGEDHIAFECRFSGRPTSVELPPEAVLAIYAQENGAGMAFEPASRPAAGESGSPDPDDDPKGGPSGSGPERGGHLKVVK